MPHTFHQHVDAVLLLDALLLQHLQRIHHFGLHQLQARVGVVGAGDGNVDVIVVVVIRALDHGIAGRLLFLDRLHRRQHVEPLGLQLHVRDHACHNDSHSHSDSHNDSGE